MKKRIGVLLSGRGSNFEALADSVAAGRIPNAEIAIVISNREGAPGIEKARERGIAGAGDSVEGTGARSVRQAGGCRACRKRKWIWFASRDTCGCFRRILWRRFAERILNIHPSLLPAFPGLESQRQALEHGAKFSGCTVHFVDENLDAGPIVLQAAVPIEDDDTPETLSERILQRRASNLYRSGAHRAGRTLSHGRPARTDGQMLAGEGRRKP